MKKPKYVNSFAVALSEKKGDVAITFFNEWVDVSVDIENIKSSVSEYPKKREIVTSVSMTCTNAHNLLEAMTKALADDNDCCK